MPLKIPAAEVDKSYNLKIYELRYFDQTTEDRKTKYSLAHKLDQPWDEKIIWIRVVADYVYVLDRRGRLRKIRMFDLL